MKKLILFLSLSTFLVSARAQTIINLTFNSTQMITPTGTYPVGSVYETHSDTINLSLNFNNIIIYNKSLNIGNTKVNGTSYSSFATLLAAIRTYIGSSSGGGGGSFNGQLTQGGTAVSSGNPLPVSAAVGGATSALQSSIGATAHNDAGQLHTDLTTGVPIIGGNSTAVKVDGSAVTQPVSLAGGNPVAYKVDGSGVTQPISGSVTANVQGGNSTAVKVDGSAVTQPVSLSGGNAVAYKVDGSAVTQPVSLASAPLPANAAQESSGHLASLDTKSASLGTAAASAASPVNIATDQPAIPVTASAPSIINSPSTVSIAALNGTVQWTVQSGGGYLLTLTNGPGVTTAWSGTVTFQYSLNNSSWSTLSVLPLTTPAAQVTTTTTNGLWFVPPIVSTGTTNQVVYIRANMTAYTSGTVYIALAPADKQNQKVLLPWTYSVTSGQTILGPLDASGVQGINIQISAITTTVLTAQGTNDPTFATYATIPVQNVTTQGVSTATITAAATYRFAPTGFKYVRLQVTTTGTVLTIQGITATLGQEIQINSFGNDIGATINGTPGVVINSGTVTAVTNVNGGQTADGSAATGNPLRSGMKIVPTTPATVAVSGAAAQAKELPGTTSNQLITKDFGTSELDYTFNFSSVSTVVSLQPLVPASGTASVRNYITGFTLQTDAIGAAGNVWLLDGQGAIGTSVTIATPGVFTSTAHDLKVGDAIVFTSLGTITGVSTNTIYYVTATSFAATTFTLATTLGGTAIAITGSTSAFTFYRLLYPIRLQTTAIGAPAMITFPTPLKGFANAALNLLIPSSLTSGNIYLTINGYRGF